MDFENDVKYISKHAYNFLTKTKIFGGEVLINKIGSPGATYIVLNLNIPISLGMNLFMITTNEKILRNIFLYIYLNTKLGKLVISRKINGAVPQTIDKEAIKTLPIPLLPMSFQLEIEKLVKDSNTALESSKALYKEAENLLYESLGIDSKNLDCHDLQGKSCDDRGESSLRWSETTEAIYPLRHCECSEESVANANDPHLQIHTQANYTIATFEESFLQTGRLDAEYYQAKYEKTRLY